MPHGKINDFAKDNTLLLDESDLKFVEEGKNSLEIKELLNRSKNSTVVDKYVKEADSLFEQSETSEDVNKELLKGWSDAIEQSIEELVKQGLNHTNAEQLVRDAVTHIDLNSQPSSKSLLSFAKANSGAKGGARRLHTMKKWGRNTVVSANEASSTAADQAGGVPVNNRPGTGGHIYRPGG